MAKYATGNPVGSSDPRDLYDNAQNLDNLVNGDQPAYNDRLGRSRKSWDGMEEEFDAAQAQRESEFDAAQAQRASEFTASQNNRDGVFNAYLVSAGYQFAGDYAAGIEITQYNQIVRDGSGEFWRVSGSTTLPYTTTGAGLPEGGALVGVGDAALRQELAVAGGVTKVNGAIIGVSSRTAMKELDVPAGVQISLEEEGRSGLFVVKTGTPPSDPQEGINVVLANGSYAERIFEGSVNIKWFGAKGDNNTEDTTAFRAAVNYCINNSGRLYIPRGTYIIDAPNNFQNIPDGCDFTISGDGSASLLKMKDGAVASRFNPLTLWMPAVGASVKLSFRDFSVDNNARNSPLDPNESPYQYEQSHTFQITGSDGIFERVYFHNVTVKDPVADVFNCGSRTCRDYLIDNCAVTERTRVRSDVQFSVLPNNIAISNFNGTLIEAEPVAVSDLSPLVTFNMSNVSVSTVDLGVDPHTDGGRVSINMVNCYVGDTFYATGQRTIVNVDNSVIKAGLAGGRNTYRLGTLLSPLEISRISNTTILLPASGDGTGNGFVADQSKIGFNNCSFVVDSAFDGNFNITGLSSQAVVLTSWSEGAIPRYFVTNCEFDRRLSSSINAFRNGIWKIKDSTLAGNGDLRAISVGISNASYISEVTIDSCDFNNVVGTSIYIARVVGARSFLVLLGEHAGESSGWFSIDAGSLNDINVISSRKIVVDSTDKDLPELAPTYGLKGDTVVRKAAPAGEPLSWYRVAYTSTGWACREQAGVQNYTTLPSANATDSGWQILYNNVPSVWDGSNWRLPGGTVAS